VAVGGEGRELAPAEFFSRGPFSFLAVSHVVYFIVVMLIAFFVTREHAHDMLFYTSF